MDFCFGTIFVALLIVAFVQIGKAKGGVKELTQELARMRAEINVLKNELQKRTARRDTQEQAQPTPPEPAPEPAPEIPIPEPQPVPVPVPVPVPEPDPEQSPPPRGQLSLFDR